MLQTLPAQTVFERQRQARWRTFLLFCLLFLIYAVFLNLLIAGVCAFLYFWSPTLWHRWASLREQVFHIVWLTTAVGGMAAAFHYWHARSQPLGKILDQLWARPADPEDKIHRVFIDVVSEAEVATGLQPIQAVVTPTPGYNAFAAQDAKRLCAIGVTEGLLARLDRDELSAVIAHEASHLVNQDSRLKTTACSLSAVFQDVQDLCGGVRGPAQAQAGVLQFLLWAVAGLGKFFTLIVGSVLSRQLEYLADAHAVQMCQNPKALAEALYKIARHGRGGVGNFEAYSALFIMNPGDSSLDEKEGFWASLFSTHPPVASRLQRLVDWAGTSLAALKTSADMEPALLKTPPATPAPAPGFFAHLDGKWAGPFTPVQLMAMRQVNPLTWVSPAVAQFAAGQDEILRAADHPQLLPIFQQAARQELSPYACPRCRTSLLQREYEGAGQWHCEFCQGDLLPAGVLERIVARREQTFTPEEIKKALQWRRGQKGSLQDRGLFPAILCPCCGERMMQAVHNLLTQVVIDRCENPACQAIWCDGGELETIQILVENAE